MHDCISCGGSCDCLEGDVVEQNCIECDDCRDEREDDGDDLDLNPEDDEC